MEDEHRGIKYSVVRGKGGGWEWRVSMGDPEVLRNRRSIDRLPR
jgi:hypothetical protein